MPRVKLRHKLEPRLLLLYSLLVAPLQLPRLPLQLQLLLPPSPPLLLPLL